MKLTDYFDHIFILHHLPKVSRKHKMEQQLKHLGIDDTSKVSWEYTRIDPLFECLYKNYSKKLVGLSIGQFNCAYGHYKIMSDALALGYKRILILEDDIAFLNNLDKIEEYAKNIPQDADLVMWDWYKNFAENEMIETKSDVLYYDRNNLPLWSTGCYIVNDTYMRHYIKEQSRLFVVADRPLTRKSNKDTLKRYRSNLPVAIQVQDGISMGSEIGYGDVAYDFYTEIGVNFNDYYILKGEV